MVLINDTPYGATEIFLDTNFGKKFNDYHNEVSWFFNEQIIRVSQSYELVFQIMSATIPLTFSNIEADIDNNHLRIYVNGGIFTYDTDVTINLADGNYNIKDL